MCLVALAIGAASRFPLVIAANRDEFHDRPTQPLGWWSPGDGRTAILGGRDLSAGGTWLGLNAAGRVALLTNIRNPARHDPQAPSRGDIVPLWLRGETPVDKFWMRVALSGFNGFNLIAADFAAGDCYWAANDGSLPRRLERGLWALSNASLDTPWPKAEALKHRLGAAIGSAADATTLVARLFDALADRSIAPDDMLPATGVPRERERALSAAFICMPDMRYGTRSSTVLVVERIGERVVARLDERSFGDDGARIGERRFDLPDWPPGAFAHNARTISTWGMPASSNSGPRSTNPART